MTNRQKTLLEISRRFPKAIEHSCNHMEAHFVPFEMLLLTPQKMLFLFDLDDISEGPKPLIFEAFMDMLTCIGWEFEDTSDSLKYMGAKMIGIVGKAPKSLIEVEERRQFSEEVIDNIEDQLEE